MSKNILVERSETGRAGVITLGDAHSRLHSSFSEASRWSYIPEHEPYWFGLVQAQNRSVEYRWCVVLLDDVVCGRHHSGTAYS